MSNQEMNGGDLLIYEAEDGSMKLDVRLEDETVWLTIEQMAELFSKGRSTINEHILNVYKEAELKKEETLRKIGNSDFSTKPTNFYNLDVIISVGYRVKSLQGTRFRQWATQRLKEFIIKGFTMDDERLKEPQGGRYFEELLARIRDIRSSEKVFWRKILDIYATSIDYDPKADSTREFFKQVQNKMHWAAHGHTAAELIYERADAGKVNMGVTNFPGDKLLKRDVEIAKNYLSEDELNVLNRIVTAYLEVAELQALNRNVMTMKDWIERLNQFLTMTGRELLENAGQVSHEDALQKANKEFDNFTRKQLSQPSLIEKHFIEAEKEIKALKRKDKKG